MLFLDYNIGYNTRGTVVHYSGLFYLHFSGGCISMNIIIRGIFFLGKKKKPTCSIDSSSASCLCVTDAVLLNLRGSDGLNGARLDMAAAFSLI